MLIGYSEHDKLLFFRFKSNNIILLHTFFFLIYLKLYLYTFKKKIVLKNQFKDEN